jgi:hypothetical protein
LSIAEREIERLQDLLADLEEIEGDDAVELAEQASFRASDAFERLRRFQTARTRELLRTIDLLAKLRKAEKPEKKPTNRPNASAPGRPVSLPSSYRSDPIENRVAEGMTDSLAKLLEAGERPSRTPKTRANEATVGEAETSVSQQVRQSVVDSPGSDRSRSGEGSSRASMAVVAGEPSPAATPRPNDSIRIPGIEGAVHDHGPEVDSGGLTTEDAEGLREEEESACLSISTPPSQSRMID